MARKILMEGPDGSREEVDPSEVKMFVDAGAHVVSRDPIPPPATVSGYPIPMPLAGLAQGATREVIQNLPSIGAAGLATLGAAGGTVAGFGAGGVPGAMGGAALGGAGGEALRQNLARLMPELGIEAPGTAGQAATEIGKQAAIQPAYELVGQGMIKGAKRFGKQVMEAGLRVPGVMRREFPQAVQDAIENRVKAGTAEAGTGIPKQKEREFVADVKRMINAAHRAGVRIPTIETIPSAVKLIQDRALISTQEARQLTRHLISYLRGKRATLTPQVARRIKQIAYRGARPVLKAAARGEASDASALVAQFRKAIADDTNQALRTRIPGYKEAEADVQRMIGMGRALKQAETRARPIFGGNPMTQVGANPGVMSGAALGITDPATLFMLAQLPRLAGNAVTQNLPKE